MADTDRVDRSPEAQADADTIVEVAVDPIVEADTEVDELVGLGPAVAAGTGVRYGWSKFTTWDQWRSQAGAHWGTCPNNLRLCPTSAGAPENSQCRMYRYQSRIGC